MTIFNSCAFGGWTIAVIADRWSAVALILLFIIVPVSVGAVSAFSRLLSLRQAIRALLDRWDRGGGAESEPSLQHQELLPLHDRWERLRRELDATKREAESLKGRLEAAEAEAESARRALAEITARRLEEEHRRLHTEPLYRTVHDLAPVGIAQLSPEGVVLDVNKAACEITGFTADELIGHHVADFTDPENRHLIPETIRRLESGETLIWELSNRRKDGELIHLELREQMLTLPRGERRIIIILHDVTDRKRANERLEESERRYRAIFNSLITGLALYEVIVDGDERPVDLKVLEVNPAFTALTGKRRDQVLGKRLTEVFPELSREWIERNGRVALTGRPIAYEEYIPFLDRYYSIIAFSPARGQLAVNFVDITDQRNALELVNMQSAALEAAPAGVMIVNRDGRIRWVNKAFTDMTGYTREEAVGNSPEILNSGQQTPDFYRDLWNTILEGGRWRGELVNRRKDGSLYLEEMIATPVFDSNGQPAYFVAIKQDITEQRKIQRQLVESQKMETIGQLAGGIAHDFNNLLQVIMGFSHLLLEEMEPANPHRADVLEIDRSARRAADLTRQLLAFSRRQIIETRVMDLNELVRSMEKIIARLLGEDIQLSIVLQPDIDKVRADPNQLEQVILNLAVNARDAMPHGGRLTISTRSIVFLKDEDWFAETERHGRYVVLEMSDTGHGMTPEVRARIFEPFFTTKGPGRGTGLGLSVVYGIVRQHDGIIRVYSEPGQGTTFRIYFPSVSAESPAETDREGQPLPPVLPRGRGERVLIVEDEAGVRDFARNALQKHAYEPFVAESAGAARAIFNAEKGRFDLLFTDVVLPDQNGLDLAEAFRKQNPNLRLLFTSGYSDEKARWPALKERGYAFLQKPYPLSILLQAVRRVLDEPPR